MKEAWFVVCIWFSFLYFLEYLWGFFLLNLHLFKEVHIWFLTFPSSHISLESLTQTKPNLYLCANYHTILGLEVMFPGIISSNMKIMNDKIFLFVYLYYCMLLCVVRVARWIPLFPFGSLCWSSSFACLRSARRSLHLNGVSIGIQCPINVLC